MRNHPIIAFVICLLFVFCAFSPVVTMAEDEWLKSEILLGIDRIYDADIEGGEKIFVGICERAPENPAPWVYRAMALLSYPIREKTHGEKPLKSGAKDVSSTDEIFRLLDKGIDLSNKIIDGLEGEDLARLQLLMATAHTLKAELHFRKKQYLKAVQSGYRAKKYLEGAYETSPKNPDVLYAVGLLKHGVENIPKVLRPFLSLMEIKSDKKLGLAYIKIGAERGVYSAVGAKLFLMLISVGEQKDYTTATRLGRELIVKYPNNPEIYFPYAYALSELKDYTGAFSVIDSFMTKSEMGTLYFYEALTGRIHHLKGKVFMDMGRLDEATDELELALIVTDINYVWVRPLAFARLGMIHDLKGERVKALKRYKSAIDTEIEGVGRALAKEYTREPYSKSVDEKGGRHTTKDKDGGVSSGPIKSGKDRSGF